jgi:hypothetical protein
MDYNSRGKRTENTLLQTHFTELPFNTWFRWGPWSRPGAGSAWPRFPASQPRHSGEGSHRALKNVDWNYEPPGLAVPGQAIRVGGIRQDRGRAIRHRRQGRLFPCGVRRGGGVRRSQRRHRSGHGAPLPCVCMRERERESAWWTHTGGGKALAFKPPSMQPGDCHSRNRLFTRVELTRCMGAVWYSCSGTGTTRVWGLGATGCGRQTPPSTSCATTPSA